MKKMLYSFGNKLGITYYLRRRKKDHLTVLSLHRISEDNDFFFQPIRPASFRKLMEYVTREYTIITFEMLRRNKKYSKPPLILSFDDGYYDFIDIALPIICQFGVPANHNLTNSCLNTGMKIWTQELNDIFIYLKNNKITDNEIVACHGKRFDECSNNWFSYYAYFFKYLLGIKYEQRRILLNRLIDQYGIFSNSKMMDWGDAAKILRCGIEIGSHSYRHDSLSTLTTEEELEKEILYSVKELEEKLNTKITIFAPPNGQYNGSVISYVKKIGISNLLIVNNQVNSLSTISSKFNIIDRIGLANESPSEMYLRVELFHSKIKKLLCKNT